MTPLPMRPLADNCTTAVDSLSRGNFRGLRAGCFPCVLGRFFRAWACFACMPGPPGSAARSPPQRTRPLAPFPGWGRAGGWGEAPVVPRDAQRPRRGHCVAKPYAEGRQAAEPVRFRGVCPAGQCPHGAHSEKSAAGPAPAGAKAKRRVPAGAVCRASSVAPSAAPPSHRRRKPPACGGRADRPGGIQISAGKQPPPTPTTRAARPPSPAHWRS